MGITIKKAVAPTTGTKRESNRTIPMVAMQAILTTATAKPKEERIATATTTNLPQTTRIKKVKGKKELLAITITTNRTIRQQK